MTRLSVITSLLLVSPPAFAERERPPEGGARPEAEVLVPSTEHGGWGGPIVEVSSIRDRAVAFVGARGGWLIGRRLTLGGGGVGLATPVPAPRAMEKPGQELDLQMGYGGAWLEYTFRPLRLLHVSVGALVGGGGISLTFHDGGSYGSGSDAFFVSEPAVMAELNVTQHVRLALGAAYRWIVGAQMEGLSYSDVAGFSAVAAVKFGKF